MQPVTFVCRAQLTIAPHDIAQQILDVTKWQEFCGYGPIPGVNSAEFILRTPRIVGSQIRVTNTDGSTHVEEITVWDPEERLQLRMTGFSKPLSRFAREFIETWDLERVGQETHVVRRFELHATSRAARGVLWLISFLLRRAVSRHLRQMKA